MNKEQNFYIALKDTFIGASVEFEDGEKVNIKDLDYKFIKPLIWW